MIFKFIIKVGMSFDNIDDKNVMEGKFVPEHEMRHLWIVRLLLTLIFRACSFRVELKHTFVELLINRVHNIRQRAFPLLSLLP